MAGVGISSLLGRRNAPEPSQPQVCRWYRQPDKPAFTPPDAVVALVRLALESGLAVGGYRSLRGLAA